MNKITEILDRNACERLVFGRKHSSRMYINPSESSKARFARAINDGFTHEKIRIFGNQRGDFRYQVQS